MQKSSILKRRSILANRKGIVDAVNGLQVLLAAIVFFGLMGLVGGILGLIQDDIGQELITTLTPSISVTNETNAWLNISGYNLSVINSSNSAYDLTAIWGNTPNQALTYNYSIALANATVSSLGVVTNATVVANETIYDNVSLTYTHTYTDTTTGQSYANLQNASVAQGNIFERLGLIGTVIVLVFILILILGVVGYFLAGKYTGNQFG